jgi:hypothetical protein
MTAELLYAIRHEWARWFAGAATAKDGADLFDGTPLSMTLAPDLDADDESVHHLVRMGMLDEVDCLAAPELAARLNADLGARTWTVNATDGHVGVEWRSGRHTINYGALDWFGNLPLAELTTKFVEHFGSESEAALAYFRAMQMHHQSPTRSLFVTRRAAVIRGRYEGFPGPIGQCTPEEALVLAGVVLRARGVFIDTLVPSVGQVRPSGYNWYCGASQELLTPYLDAFAHLVDQAESTDNADLNALQYLQGIHARFKTLLRAHDRLGALHLRALRSGANNDITDQQSDAFYTAVQAAGGMLEGTAVLIAELEGNVPQKEWRSVTFPTLVAGERPWTKGIEHGAHPRLSGAGRWQRLGDRLRGAMG